MVRQALLLLLIGPVVASESPLNNANLEDGGKGNPPAYWFFPKVCAEDGYSAVLSDDRTHEGKYEGTAAEWFAGFALSLPRWSRWLNSKPVIRDGRINFGPAAIRSEILSTVLTEFNRDDSTSSMRPVFNLEDLGKLPKGWTAEKTGLGDGSVWKIVADDSASSKTGCALAQIAEGPTQLYNLCVYDASLKDLELRVKLKPVSGKIDQGGGVVWRYKDAKNYYICRYNPLEENFRVYRVVNGKRIQLQTKESIRSEPGKWHEISIHHVQDKIKCSLDGAMLLEVSDDTIPDAGKVGLWTKADAVTHFDAPTFAAK